MPPYTVVVLGGGISGLSVAFYLARTLPSSSRVLLLERSERVGGYIRSTALAGDATQLPPGVTLEAGPRTLRPNSTAVLELVRPVLLTPNANCA
jgi:protoporphyrinogen/coproporphyrinogen III oxidase